jgi:hypothetical protein
LSDDKLIELLIDQRNEHINRLFSLNGQVTVLILTLSVSIVFGAVSGVDKLDAIERFHTGLLYTAGGFFFVSVFLIALALVHHGQYRSLAANSLEQAIHKLLEGQERSETLASLNAAIRDLVPEHRRHEESLYLASELNSRWYLLSLYHKTFLGCASLLLASVICAFAVVTSTPKRDTEQKATEAVQGQNANPAPSPIPAPAFAPPTVGAGKTQSSGSN